MSGANFYHDPNAYVQRVKVKSEKQKVDLNHIERVVYPQPYENIPSRYDKEHFASQSEKTSATSPKQNNNNVGGGLDINKILPLLTSGGNLNSLLPKLLGNFGVNQDILSLFNNLKPVKKVESKVVENFESDTISKYKKVKK